jgi:hypothetical protein
MYPNEWQPPIQDERWETLLRISNGIQTTYEIVSGTREAGDLAELEATLYPFLTPLRLATLLREAADTIESLTEPEASTASS